MRFTLGDDAVGGSFEELPALLVVLVAVSLFSASLAHATVSRSDSWDYAGLREDCLAFAGMVAASPLLCVPGHAGVFGRSALENVSASDLTDAFDPFLLGFEYRIIIQCLDLDTGDIGLEAEWETADASEASQVASFNTCANVMESDAMGAARLSVSVWRPSE